MISPPDDVTVVTVFAAGPGGGNPAPVALTAYDWSDERQQEVAQRSGHESAFVVTSPPGADLALRFWVPRHEMPMCGHATIAAVWLLAEHGRLTRDHLVVHTASGLVQARVRPGEGQGHQVEVSQPPGRADGLGSPAIDEVLDVLGLRAADLAARPVQNAATSRVKTLVPLASQVVLDALTPDWDRVESLCDRLGSTGLYPYAQSASGWSARQFPRSSGYPEDPATGIAATALAAALDDNGDLDDPDAPVVINQGTAMGRPSRMTVRLDRSGGVIIRCWLGGPAHLDG